MKLIRKNFDFVLFALVVAGFVFVAAQRLGDVPLPDSDEAMTLQVPYEVLNHGKLAFPMYGFLGGNIKNAWHSLTPLYFVMLSGFLKVAGWGLAQGRAFNLITAVILLFMTYLIARKLFSWQVGLIAVLLLISDPIFLTRSRVLRNDLIAAAFGLLAFYLYEKAEDAGRRWYYLASGLSAGAAVMCHTNMLYMLFVIAVLLLLRDGWRIVKQAKPYLFAAGALAAMAYEIIFALVDYQNFVLQMSKDNVHFRVLEPWGWLQNLRMESSRYAQWFDAHGAKIAPEVTLLRIFLFLSAIAIIYLAARALIQVRRGNAMAEPRVRLLVATLIVAFFFAVVTQRKVTQYAVHLAPWFALCTAVLLNDAVTELRRLRELRWHRAKLAYGGAMVLVALLAAGFVYELIEQNRSYLVKVRNPNQAGFEEIKTVLRSVVPDGLCPVSIASGYLWLAFPEYDQCYFAYMEAPLNQHLDIDGREYALIMHPKYEGRLRKLTGGGFEKYHLLAELRKTPYGTLNVYYTGADPRYLALTPRQYYFFGRQRGYVGDQQIAAGREVWAAAPAELERTISSVELPPEPEAIDADQAEESERSKFTNLCSVELDPNKVYQLCADPTEKGEFRFVVFDDRSGEVIQRITWGGAEEPQRLEGLFKTSSSGRIRLAMRSSGGTSAESLPFSRISLREIAPL